MYRERQKQDLLHEQCNEFNDDVTKCVFICFLPLKDIKCIYRDILIVIRYNNDLNYIKNIFYYRYIKYNC